MVSLKHKFASAKADGTDSTLIKPSNWNDEHNFVTVADSVVLGRAVGTGAGAVVEIPYASIIAAVLPAGVIWPYGGLTAPPGFLLCNGAAIIRTAYPALFTAIGTTFGAGDGSTTFNLPNMQGRVATGPGGTLGGTLGGSGGNAANRQPRHYGSVDVNVNVNGSAWSDGVNFYYSGGLGSAGVGSGAGSNFVTSGNAPNVFTNMASSGNGSGSIRNDGGNVTDAFDILQPYLIVNYIIKT